MEIQINQVTKTYGKKKALDSITMEIESGIFGLLGPNGAGKTTLMKILATLLVKNLGEIRIDSIPIEQTAEIRKIIGYLPQDFSFYPDFTVMEALEYLAVLSGNTKNKETIHRLLKKVNLLEEKKTKVKALSGGMKRRLGIAQALLNDPKIIIVDEPTAGLDPEERLRFRSLLEEFAINRTVILSTHIVSDIEISCNKVGILKEGKIVYTGSIQDLKKSAKDQIWDISVTKEEYEREIKGVVSEESIITCVQVENSYHIKVVNQKAPFKFAVPIEPSIEDAYMKIMRL